MRNFDQHFVINMRLRSIVIASILHSTRNTIFVSLSFFFFFFFSIAYFLDSYGGRNVGPHVLGLMGEGGGGGEFK